MNATSSDSPDRFWWRCKETLDAADSLEAAIDAAPGAKYVIFFEDDLIMASTLLQELTTFTAQQSAANKSVDVMTLYTTNGDSQPRQISNPFSIPWFTQGVMLRRTVVQDLVLYLRSRFAEAPVDGLLLDFIKAQGLQFWAYYPNLIQHVGVTSSLKGKTSQHRSQSFRDQACAAP